MTGCLAESLYLLESSLRTRGYSVCRMNGRTVHVTTSQGAKFDLSFLDGNRRVLVSNHVWVPPEDRGRGEGRRLLNLREVVAREAGVNLLMATVHNTNKPEIHLLSTSGWKRLLNRRETKVSLWIKKL
jgi:GNAT superfamily N-acetyltransferase